MSQGGGSAIKILIALVVIAAVGVGGVRVVPVYVNVYEFEDAMRSQAKFATVERKTPEGIRDDLYKKAKELELPLTREQIQVSTITGGVAIAARFTVPVDLVVTQRNFEFNLSADTRSAY